MPATCRLAAILAADVAGYSRLMGEDEIGTVQALREHHATAEPARRPTGRADRQDHW
jgi:class 3 adenylate cyclase